MSLLTLFIRFAGCNRTYYGDIGQTYALELHRPKQDRVPFVCVLTFTAAGGQHGDVVQVSNHYLQPFSFPSSSHHIPPLYLSQFILQSGINYAIKKISTTATTTTERKSVSNIDFKATQQSRGNPNPNPQRRATNEA